MGIVELNYFACDPNSKQYGKQNKDTKYDEPPEIFEKKTKKIKDDSDAKWEDEEKRERMLQREALRDLRQTTAKNALKEKTIEGKRADESMQEFKARIRKETRKTLAEEITKMTATAVKRKMRLKERSQKRKSKKNGNNQNAEEEDDANNIQDFYSAENGHLRPSDLGESRTSFRPTEQVVFGAAPERPPDLHVYTAKFRVTNTAKSNASHSTTTTTNASTLADADEDHSEHEEDEDMEEPETMTKNMRNKKRKALALSRVSMDGDDGLESVHLPVDLPIQLKRQNVINSSGTPGSAGSAAGKKDKYGILVDAAVKTKKNSVVKTGIKNQDEMEKLRAKVQEAYKLMKEKRRLEG
eukprot:gene7593-9094_t